MSSTRNDATRPDGALPIGLADQDAALAPFTSRALAQELVLRMRAGRVWTEDSELALLGARLLHGLRDQLDLHENRFSLRRYGDLFTRLFREPGTIGRIADATVLDIGCGGVNPGGFLFVLLALGASRCFAVDLDDLADPRQVVRALADVAAAMLLDPGRIVGDAAIEPARVLRHLASFDLAKLHAGDGAGIDPARLLYRQESADSMSLPDASIDVVVSNSFFEHVADPDRVIREIARVTRTGGIGTHTIDLTDHRRYGSDCHPLQFLCAAGDGMLHGSNRLRASAFVQRFTAAGLRVLRCTTLDRIEVDATLRASFAARFRDLDQADLECGNVCIVTEKVPQRPTLA